MSKTAKRAYLTLRLQADLLERLQQLAERNERSVAGEARLAFKAHLDRADNGRTK